MPGIDERNGTPPSGRIYQLMEQVRSLNDKIDALRADLSSGRAEFRGEVRSWIERHEASIQREFEKLWIELKARANATDLEKINSNIRTVVMTVILIIVAALVGLVVVNKPSLPMAEHVVGSAK